MELSIIDLYPLQEELDDRIFRLHQTDRMTTRNDRILALFVEVGEMINETKCFKYWSLKPASSKAVILEEYGDGIHFLLSLGIDLFKVEQRIGSCDLPKDLPLTEIAILVYQQISRLKDDFSIEQYRKAFSLFLTLGERLSFTADDIRCYYLKKNQINHQRQDNHY